AGHGRGAGRGPAAARGDARRRRARGAHDRARGGGRGAAPARGSARHGAGRAHPDHGGGAAVPRLSRRLPRAARASARGAARAGRPPGHMIDAALRAVRARSELVPDVAIILGTGLGGLARELAVATRIPYQEIPGFPLSTVESHAGELLFGTLAGRRVVAMQGRFHRYEGYTLQQIALPVRVLRRLGAGILVVSNACGGMHPLWNPGDLMLIADHINLLGDNPLVGAHRGAEPHPPDPWRARALELMAYPPLDPKLSADALEKQLLATWKHERLFARTQDAMRYGPPFVFYEGPPTANGRPGIHHVFS